jgi:hypothetical protein
MHTHAAAPLTATPQVALGITGLPDEVLPEMLESDTFMKAFHHVLLEVRLRQRPGQLLGCVAHRR